MANFGRVSGNCIRFKHGYHVYNVYRVHPCNPGYIRFLKSKDLAKSGHLVDDVANGPCGPNFLVLAIRRPPPQHPEFPWKNVVASRTVENLDENLTISDNFLNQNHLLTNHVSIIIVYPQGLNGLTAALPLLGDVNEANLAQGVGGVSENSEKM